MSALKVGDRVHVEFDGTIVCYHRDHPENFNVAREPDGVHHMNLAAEYLTKLPEPEPKWALGDVILHGSVLYQFQDEEYWLCMSGGFAKPVLVSKWWAAGGVQRLVPEAQK